jgi:hypothetical protein
VNIYYLAYGKGQSVMINLDASGQGRTFSLHSRSEYFEGGMWTKASGQFRDVHVSASASVNIVAVPYAKKSDVSSGKRGKPKKYYFTSQHHFDSAQRE